MDLNDRNWSYSGVETGVICCEATMGSGGGCGVDEVWMRCGCGKKVGRLAAVANATEVTAGQEAEHGERNRRPPAALQTNPAATANKNAHSRCLIAARALRVPFLAQAKESTRIWRTTGFSSGPGSLLRTDSHAELQADTLTRWHG